MISSWAKQNWGVVLVGVAGLLIGMALLFLLQPREPNPPAYHHSEGRTANYQPGGSGCEPPVLAAIKDRLKALAERNRCADEAEEYRLKSDDLVQQTRAADAAAAQAASSYELTWIALWGTVIGMWTLIAAGLAAYFARNAAYSARDSYNAFVKVEDASLVVEFPSGSLIESVKDGVKQPDSHCFDVVITNIGRSTARIHGWTIGDGRPERREHTLAKDATWAIANEMIFIPQNGYFRFSIHYSSPLNERMVLDAKAKVKALELANGATHYSGQVKSSRLRTED